MKKLFLIASMAAIAASCEKKKTEPVDTAVITFTNQLAQPVTIRLADSGGYNPFYLHVAAYGTVNVPNEKFKTVDDGQYKGIVYYWATDDFSMSNWYMMNGVTDWISKCTIPYKKNSNYNIDIISQPERKDMQYALNSMDGETKWHAIDAFDGNGTNVWGTLNASVRNKKMVIQYHYRALVSDGVSELPIAYTLAGDEKTFRLKSDVNSPTVEMSNITGVSWLKSRSADTAFLWLDGKPPYYVMVKQP